MIPCECVLSASIIRLGTLLDTVEVAKNATAFTAATRKTLAEMHEELRLHQTDYKEQYARNMIEMRKQDAINHTQQPLQTSVWTQGDERKMREKPPRKTTKKKLNMDGGIAATSSKATKPKAPPKKRQKKVTPAVKK